MLIDIKLPIIKLGYNYFELNDGSKNIMIATNDKTFDIYNSDFEKKRLNTDLILKVKQNYIKIL